MTDKDLRTLKENDNRGWHSVKVRELPGWRTLWVLFFKGCGFRVSPTNAVRDHSTAIFPRSLLNALITATAMLP